MKRQTREEADAEALELGANVLAKSVNACGGSSPAVATVEKALEILLRKEAERMRFEARGRKSLAVLFPDKAEAAA